MIRSSLERPSLAQGARRSAPNGGVRRALATAVALVAVLATGACQSIPEYQRLEADPLFEWSNTKFGEGDWDDAIKGYERMVFTFPAYPQIVQVRINLARSYFNRGEYITAASEFTRVQDRHPGHPLIPQAALGACEAYTELSPIPERDQSFTNSALNTCTSILIDYPGTDEAVTARELRDNLINTLAQKEYLRGHFYFRRGFYDSANVYFQQVLALYSQSAWAPTALLRMHEGYTRIGYEEEAEEVRNRILNEYPESPEAEVIRTGGTPGDEGVGGSAA